MYPNKTEIKKNEIHLWLADDRLIHKEELIHYYKSLINQKEAYQQQQFHHQENRHRYLITRVLLRTVLSFYIPSLSPQDWFFINNPHGKPYIGNPLPIPLHFNLSHTRGLIILIIALNPFVGIDVEDTNTAINYFEIAKSFFSTPEINWLANFDFDHAKKLFYAFWTLKEAYAKALAKGLSICLDEFWFEYKNKICLMLNGQAQESWQFHQFSKDNHYISVAIKNAETQNYLFKINEIIPYLCIQKADLIDIPIIWG